MAEKAIKKFSEKKYYDNVNLGKRTKQVVYFCEQQDKAAMFEFYIKNNDKKNIIYLCTALNIDIKYSGCLCAAK